MNETDSNESKQGYYQKEMFVCRNCGERRDTSTEAESCYWKDCILDLSKEIDAPAHIQMKNVIKIMESLVENGEIIDTDDAWWEKSSKWVDYDEMRSAIEKSGPQVATTAYDLEKHEDRCYKTNIFVCRNCGKEWEVPGSAELCCRKDHILELTEEINKCDDIQLDSVIEIIASAIKTGVAIDDNDEWWG